MAVLDQNAVEHPAGHHGKLVARYVLRSEAGVRIGFMFEKSDKTKPLLWVEHRFLRYLVHDDIECKVYPASALYRAVEPSGKQPYGRHAALKSMLDLAQPRRWSSAKRALPCPVPSANVRRNQKTKRAQNVDRSDPRPIRLDLERLLVWQRVEPNLVIEQTTYLLFIKRLDDLHTLAENKARTLGGPIARRIFPEGTFRFKVSEDPNDDSYIDRPYDISTAPMTICAGRGSRTSKGGSCSASSTNTSSRSCVISAPRVRPATPK